MEKFPAFGEQYAGQVPCSVFIRKGGLHMSHGLNSLKGVIGDSTGNYYGGY